MVPVLTPAYIHLSPIAPITFINPSQASFTILARRAGGNGLYKTPTDATILRYGSGGGLDALSINLLIIGAHDRFNVSADVKVAFDLDLDRITSRDKIL